MARLPPSWVVFLCLLLFGLGELAGALLGGYPQPIMDWARKQAVNHPEVHGIVGVPDIDRAILEGIGTEALSRVHTFHLHAHGLALVVFVLSLIIANMNLLARTQKIMTGLVCLGLLYPFGWLTIVFALPIFGKSEAFRLAEDMLFIPFGGGFLAAVWLLIFLYFFMSVWMPKTRDEEDVHE
jgi:hypothetical protein